MKKPALLLVLFSAILAMGFVKNKNYRYSQNSCAAASCHVYQPEMVDLKVRENLTLALTPAKSLKKGKVSAEMVNEEGQIVDYKEKLNKRNQMILNAPAPGKYKVLVGFKAESAGYDSFLVDIKPSIISLTSANYSASALKFLPIHPNPVSNGACVSRFVLPKNADIELTLYKLGGKKIRTLFKGELNAGMHTFNWETRDDAKRPLRTGNYLCELKYGNQKVVQKLYIVNN